jgi:hypothetical protein
MDCPIQAKQRYTANKIVNSKRNRNEEAGTTCGQACQFKRDIY